MSRDINGIECLQNGISMHDRSNQIDPNSGEFCSNSSNIRDSSRPIPNTNHCSHEPKRSEKEENYFESRLEGQMEVGSVLAQSGGQNGNFLNQDECDQTFSKLNKSESEGELGKENGQLEKDISHVSPKVQDPTHNPSVLENNDNFERRQEKSSEQLDLTNDQRLNSTDPVIEFRVQSPEDGYFSNKEDTSENPSPVKKRSPGMENISQGRDYDSTLDSSLEMDSSLQVSPENRSRIENQNRLLDSSSEMPQLGSNRERELMDSSWHTPDTSQQISNSKIQEMGPNMKSWLENSRSDQIQLSAKTEEPTVAKIDSLLQTPSLSTSLHSLTNKPLSPPTPKTVEDLEKSPSDSDNSDKNTSRSLQVGQGKHPISHSSPKLYHDDPTHPDLKTSSPSMEELPRPSSGVGEREHSVSAANPDDTLLRGRGMTICLDGTSVSFDERGHIVPDLQEADVSGRRHQGKGKGVFETLFRPDPRYWPKLLAAGWTKRGAREQKQGSKYATIKGYLRRRHSLSKGFQLKRGKGEVGFYFDNLVTILKAAVSGI